MRLLLALLERIFGKQEYRDPVSVQVASVRRQIVFAMKILDRAEERASEAGLNAEAAHMRAILFELDTMLAQEMVPHQVMTNEDWRAADAENASHQFAALRSFLRSDP